MKKWILGIVVLIAIAGIGFIALDGGRLSIAGVNTTKANALSEPKANKLVTAEAKVVPVSSASLSLMSGGTVAEVRVNEGDRVESGEVLLRLVSDQQAAAVAQAEAVLARAQARVNEFKAGPRAEEIAAAQAAVTLAQANLARLQQPPDENQLIAGRAELANAGAALKQAQAAYDRAGGASNPYAGMLPTSLALEQATNAYTAANARLNALLKGPSAADLAPARAQVSQAQAQLALVKAGARPETIVEAEADVAAAQAALQQAKVALAYTELRAPFAGTVVSLNIKVAEFVAPGLPIVRLADLSRWQMETDDLTENDVVKIREGDAVTLTFDAIPNLELPGRVARVNILGENHEGDIVYQVVVTPARQDERLRWNMTASASVEPQ